MLNSANCAVLICSAVTAKRDLRASTMAAKSFQSQFLPIEMLANLDSVPEKGISAGVAMLAMGKTGRVIPRTGATVWPGMIEELACGWKVLNDYVQRLGPL